jgi:hypothetical protein
MKGEAREKGAYIERLEHEVIFILEEACNDRSGST